MEKCFRLLNVHGEASNSFRDWNSLLTDFFAFHSSNDGSLLRGDVGKLSCPRAGVGEVGVPFLP